MAETSENVHSKQKLRRTRTAVTLGRKKGVSTPVLLSVSARQKLVMVLIP